MMYTTQTIAKEKFDKIWFVFQKGFGFRKQKPKSFWSILIVFLLLKWDVAKAKGKFKVSLPACWSVYL